MSKESLVSGLELVCIYGCSPLGLPNPKIRRVSPILCPDCSESVIDLFNPDLYHKLVFGEPRHNYNTGTP